MNDFLETAVRKAVTPTEQNDYYALAILHPFSGHEHKLGELPITLGRDDSCEIILDDSSISRTHARIQHGDIGLVLCDLGSKNGCFVNRKPVQDQAEIRVGDILRLGEIVFRLVARSVEEVGNSEEEGEESALIGGPSLAGVRRHIRLLGPTSLRLMITGESGSGKEVVARELHRQSGRGGPFIAVNCAAIPDTLVEAELFGYVRGAFTGALKDKIGLFEAAKNGTLFLDEVTELPLPGQAKLLRAVETGEVRRIGAVQSTTIDCRIISATNRVVSREIEQEHFRGDLAARLSEAEVNLPPLRHRIEDLPLLIRHLAKRAGCRMGFSAEAMEILACYRWPLNVRELDNAVRMLNVLAEGRELQGWMLPEQFSSGHMQIHSPPNPTEKEEQVFASLRENNGNIRRTGQQLGVSRSYIYRCLDRAGIDLARIRSGTKNA
ncbi:MAG: sigma 54-interacting transcriptional regulator [Pseudomonadota bacterium]